MATLCRPAVSVPEYLNALEGTLELVRSRRAGHPRPGLQSSPPPDHKRHFEELPDILSADGPVDHGAIAALRRRYDIEQLTPLRRDQPARRP